VKEAEKNPGQEVHERHDERCSESDEKATEEDAYGKPDPALPSGPARTREATPKK
jgi:hypothetical protein